MQCPNCGAPASPDATRCGYCRARLATISCPSCLGPVFTGAAFCPRCGTPAARQPVDAKGKVCPRCRDRMTPVAVGELSVNDCGRCDGVWVDPPTFERLCSQREHATLEVLASGRGPRGAAAPAGSRPERIRYRRCPDCGKFMNRMNFARASGIVLDVCREHGTFFDAGELKRLVDFIGEGGLVKARQAEMEALEERRREIERLEATRSAQSSRGASREFGGPLSREIGPPGIWALLARLTKPR